MKAMILAASMAAIPVAASAMPITSVPPTQGEVQRVQWLPPGYPYDPCEPGAPPVRMTERDEWGRPYPVIVPAYRFCRRPPVYVAPPPPVYAPPVYVPPRGYDEYGWPIYRRPPPPGWERDPYTGRDTRILR